jgi:hypothetical protein
VLVTDVSVTATETRRVRLFRALAQNPEPLSTPQLVSLLAEPGPRQRLLARYSPILREEEQAGRVERAGRTPGGPGRRGRSALRWDITNAGRAWLARHDKAQALAAAAAQEAQRSAAERDRALAEARASFGRQTWRFERKRVAHQLRDLGCTLEEIGAVFAVTREMIRQDPFWDPESPAPRSRKPAKADAAPKVPYRRKLSAGQTRLLLAMHLGQLEDARSFYMPTIRALKDRGFITVSYGYGPGHIYGHALTAEGRAAARQLAEDRR